MLTVFSNCNPPACWHWQHHIHGMESIFEQIRQSIIYIHIMSESFSFDLSAEFQVCSNPDYIPVFKFRFLVLLKLKYWWKPIRCKKRKKEWLIILFNSNWAALRMITDYFPVEGNSETAEHYEQQTAAVKRKVLRHNNRVGGWWWETSMLTLAGSL